LDANGCTLQLSVTIGSTGTPGASAGGNKQLTCALAQLSLDGSSPSNNVSFSWTAAGGGNIVSGANTASPVVNAAGSYTLTVTDLNSGCSSSDQVTVTMDNTPPGATAAVDGTLSCNVTTVVLQGTGNGSFAWTGPSGFTSTDQTPSVSEAGTYTLVVTGSNGCTSTATTEVDMDNDLPGAQAAGGTLSCNVTSVVLQGSGNGSFAWSGPNGFTSTDQNPSVSEAGTYTLVVTRSEGRRGGNAGEVDR